MGVGKFRGDRDGFAGVFEGFLSGFLAGVAFQGGHEIAVLFGNFDENARLVGLQAVGFFVGFQGILSFSQGIEFVAFFYQNSSRFSKTDRCGEQMERNHENQFHASV